MSLCLVTGGAGFIGSHLSEALIGRGFRVRVLDDFSSGREENLSTFAERVDVVRGDLTEYVPIPTGFDPLDGMIGGGLRKTELILLGGAQGIGKTIATLQIARNIAMRKGQHAFYLSYEHTETARPTGGRGVSCSGKGEFPDSQQRLLSVPSPVSLSSGACPTCAADCLRSFS